MSSQKFNDALLRAVDFAFDSLGKSCTQALYFHLQKTFHVGRAEIPEKVEEFRDAVRLIFKNGAIFLEKLILEKLCENLGVEVGRHWEDDFVEAVTEVRRMFLEKEPFLSLSDFDDEITLLRRKRGGEKFAVKG
jgi:hypothetical protein